MVSASGPLAPGPSKGSPGLPQPPLPCPQLSLLAQRLRHQGLSAERGIPVTSYHLLSSRSWSKGVNLGQERLQCTGMGRDEGRCDLPLPHTTSQSLARQQWDLLKQHYLQLEPPTPIPRAESVPRASWE